MTIVHMELLKEITNIAFP